MVGGDSIHSGTVGTQSTEDRRDPLKKVSLTLNWVAQMVKNLPAMQEIWVPSLGQEAPLEKGIGAHPVFLPGKSHGQRSLAGYSPWSHKNGVSFI